MNVVAFLRDISYRLGHYIQKIQYLIITFIVIGLVDYFFLYDMFLSLAAFAPVAAIEALPLVILIIAALFAWRMVRYVRKKMGGSDRGHKDFS